MDNLIECANRFMDNNAICEAIDMDMGKYLTIDANGKTVKYVYANFHKDIDIVKIIDRSLRSLQGIKIIEIDGIEK